MKKYLFIGGPAGKQYHEASGDVNVVWHDSPVFAVEEAQEITPSGRFYAYNLRTLVIGDDYVRVYALSQLCNAEVIDLLFHAYARF